MSAWRDNPEISQYLDGQGTPEIRRALEQRVEQAAETDAELRHFLKDWAKIRTAFGGLPRHKLPEDFADRVLAAIAEVNGESQNGTPQRAGTRPGRITAAAQAAGQAKQHPDGAEAGATESSTVHGVQRSATPAASRPRSGESQRRSSWNASSWAAIAAAAALLAFLLTPASLWNIGNDRRANRDRIVEERSPLDAPDAKLPERDRFGQSSLNREPLNEKSVGDVDAESQAVLANGQQGPSAGRSTDSRNTAGRNVDGVLPEGGLASGQDATPPETYAGFRGSWLESGLNDRLKYADKAGGSALERGAGNGNGATEDDERSAESEYGVAAFPEGNVANPQQGPPLEMDWRNAPSAYLAAQPPAEGYDVVIIDVAAPGSTSNADLANVFQSALYLPAAEALAQNQLRYSAFGRDPAARFDTGQFGERIVSEQERRVLETMQRDLGQDVEESRQVQLGGQDREANRSAGAERTDADTSETERLATQQLDAFYAAGAPPAGSAEANLAGSLLQPNADSNGASSHEEIFLVESTREQIDAAIQSLSLAAQNRMQVKLLAAPPDDAANSALVTQFNNEAQAMRELLRAQAGGQVQQQPPARDEAGANSAADAASRDADALRDETVRRRGRGRGRQTATDEDADKADEGLANLADAARDDEAAAEAATVESLDTTRGIAIRLPADTYFKQLVKNAEIALQIKDAQDAADSANNADDEAQGVAQGQAGGGDSDNFADDQSGDRGFANSAQLNQQQSGQQQSGQQQAGQQQAQGRGGRSTDAGSAGGNSAGGGTRGRGSGRTDADQNNNQADDQQGDANQATAGRGQRAGAGGRGGGGGAGRGGGGRQRAEVDQARQQDSRNNAVDSPATEFSTSEFPLVAPPARNPDDVKLAGEFKQVSPQTMRRAIVILRITRDAAATPDTQSAAETLKREAVNAGKDR